jgi:single-strand DNA-binding protein
MNEAQVFVAGYVAREPKFRTTHNGYSYTSLRVGYTPRRMDRDSGEWSDGGTSFVTVFCWRRLADNVATCVRKGDPVLIKGKLQVRPYTDKDGAARVAVEVEASSIGHDLARGVANFQRAHRTAGETALERVASEVRPDEPGVADAAADGVPAAAPGGIFAEDAVAALTTAGVDDLDEDAEQAADEAEPGAGPDIDAEPAGVATPF